MITSLSPWSYIGLAAIAVNVILVARFYLTAIANLRSSNTLIGRSVHKSVFYGDAPPIARAYYGRAAEMISFSILMLAAISYHESYIAAAIMLAIPGVGLGVWFRFLDYKWRKSKGIT